MADLWVEPDHRAKRSVLVPCLSDEPQQRLLKEAAAAAERHEGATMMDFQQELEKHGQE